MSALTRQQVIDVAGRLDDDLVMKIIETGASLDELLEAHTWLSEDDYMGRELHRPVGGRVAAVFDLLKQTEAAEREERGP